MAFTLHVEKLGSVRHRHLRLAAASNGTNVQQYVLQAITEKLMTEPVVRLDMAAQVANAKTNGPGTGTIGRQPQSVGNPKGELLAVPIVGMSAYQLTMMSGPQTSATAGGKGFNPAQAPA